MKLITNPNELPGSWCAAFSMTQAEAEKAKFPQERKVYLKQIHGGVLFIIQEDDESK
jgi:hypothetical protein